ncbi:MAG: hypothetical protein DRI28_01325 [Caldiserica bacterium]|nr:MAG: hypothetical protein DRI28_01325 [Caldisericota bacterium]
MVEIKPSEEWVEIGELFERKGKKLLVIGASDSGKTSFLLFILNFLLKRGKKVGILDFDIGQSSIGPPTTVGFGLANKEVKSLGEIKPEKLYFVGSVSPKGHLLQMLIGVEKLTKESEKYRIDYLLVDTTGLVDGPVAEILKEAKIEIINPDFIILFEEKEERENLIKPFLYSEKEIIRLRPSPYVSQRNREERIKYRENRFKEYFKERKILKVIFSEKNLLGINLDYEIPPPGTLISLLDRDRFCISLGIVKNLDRESSAMTIVVPASSHNKNIKFIKFSRYTMDF